MSQALPEDFRVLLSLVNSRDLGAGTETLPDGDACRTWFRAHQFREDPTFTERDVAAVHHVREGIRALWLAHNEGHFDEGAVKDLNAILQTVDFHWQVDPASAFVPYLTDRDGTRYCGQLVALLAVASQHPHWSRLKACQNAACHWAFYDQSRNRSHRWCSMTACGSREKARRYRERQRQRGE